MGDSRVTANCEQQVLCRGFGSKRRRGTRGGAVVAGRFRGSLASREEVVHGGRRRWVAAREPEALQQRMERLGRGGSASSRARAERRCCSWRRWSVSRGAWEARRRGRGTSASGGEGATRWRCGGVGAGVAASGVVVRARPAPAEGPARKKNSVFFLLFFPFFSPLLAARLPHISLSPVSSSLLLCTLCRSKTFVFSLTKRKSQKKQK